MNRARLGVNIDHVATLRQARGEVYPSIKRAAEMSLEAGADQITIHLREDRRHIQDHDLAVVQSVTKEMGRLFNLEIGAAEEIVDIALKTKPDWICLVPEKREEKTTEGGLDLLNENNFNKLAHVIAQFREHCPETKISLFVEAEEETLKKCHELKVDAVEIHTGEYARDILEGKDYNSHITSYTSAKEFCEKNSIGFHAGHGLTDDSLKPLVDRHLFAEYNIGHWIISDSVFVGIENSIKKLTQILGRQL